MHSNQDGPFLTDQLRRMTRHRKTTDAPNQEQRPRRGRKQLDIAVRLRNWGWYWLVKMEAGVSDDELDRRYAAIGRDIRPRLFFQFRSLGSSPTEERGYRSRRDGKKGRGSVYERVHRSGEFNAARDWFESSFWKLVMPPQPESGYYSVFIETMLAKNGWFRASADDETAARIFLKKMPAAFQEWKSKAFEHSLRYFVAGDSLDDIAMLAALYQEAYLNAHLELAIRLRDALTMSVVSYCETNNLWDNVGKLLIQIVDDRVIGHRWISGAERDQKVVPRVFRTVKLKAFASNYVEEGRQWSRRETHPIVMATPELNWLREHSSEIASMADVSWEELRAESRTGRIDNDLISRLSERKEREVRRKFKGSFPRKISRDTPLSLDGRREFVDLSSGEIDPIPYLTPYLV